MDIVPADSMEVVRELFVEYQDYLGFSLCFQGFEEELAAFPGYYAPPQGRLLVARDGEQTAGCVALRPLQAGICEMKRLYVRAAYRSSGLGRRLAERVIAEGWDAGYQAMRLDTLDTLTAAMQLYERLGFVPIEPYNENPRPDVRYFELRKPLP